MNALNQLAEADLEKIIYIRNDGHTVTEAINRQLAHYPYHIGQMVFIAKMLKNEDWKTLSIARNKSADYNSQSFAGIKTDGIIQMICKNESDMIINTKNTKYYQWGNNCQAWTFIQSENVIVKEELMPPYTEEQLHFHK